MRPGISPELRRAAPWLILLGLNLWCLLAIGGLHLLNAYQERRYEDGTRSFDRIRVHLIAASRSSSGEYIPLVTHDADGRYIVFNAPFCHEQMERAEKEIVPWLNKKRRDGYDFVLAFNCNFLFKRR